jgi:hypothetical protein
VWTPDRGCATSGAAFARRLLSIAILFALLGIPSARAAVNGRWWWVADIGLRYRTNESFRDGASTGSFGQEELAGSFGLNGFIVHPNLANFRIDTDLALNRFNRRGDVDSNLLALGANANFIPEGAVPSRLYFRRRGYDYTTADEFDPLTRTGWPDLGTDWGGGLRVRRGALRGLVLGFDSRRTEFVDPRARTEHNDRQFIDWSRTTPRFNHHVRLRHKDWQLGTVDLDIEDYALNVNERGAISRNWRWESLLSGFVQNTTSSGLTSTVGDYRLRNRFLGAVREQDQIDIAYNLSSVHPVSGDTIVGNALSALYRWQAAPRIHVGPFVRYSIDRSEDIEIAAPRAGVVASWRRSKRRLDTALTGRVGYGSLRRENASQVMEQSEWTYAFTGSVGHGRPEGLRKDLEVELNVNQLSQITRLFDIGGGLPPLGFPRSDLDRDFRRVRMSFAHRWDSSSWNAWGQWSLRTLEDPFTFVDVDLETYTAAWRFATARWDVNVEASETGQRDSGDDQTLRAVAGSANWRPLPYLLLAALFRSDRREVDLLPDVDGSRIDLRATVLMGRLRAEIWFSQISDQIDGGPERTNRNVRVAATMRFNGLLPVVTGTKRRGIIR